MLLGVGLVNLQGVSVRVLGNENAQKPRQNLEKKRIAQLSFFATQYRELHTEIFQTVCMVTIDRHWACSKHID